MYAFFSRTVETQKLVMKDWIRNAIAYKRSETVGSSKSRSFVLSGVYIDAPSNKKFARVCQNSLILLFNHGYHKFTKIKADIENPEVAPHGHANKMPNSKKASLEAFNKIIDSLHKFFETLKEQGEAHSSRVVREETGTTLRDEDGGTIYLHPSYTKRQLYSRF